MGELPGAYPDTLYIMSNLAEAYRNQNKWDEAGELEWKVPGEKYSDLPSPWRLSMSTLSINSASSQSHDS